MIYHPSDCDDAVVSRHVAGALGSSITKCQGNGWMVRARHQPFQQFSQINVNESGTVLRLVLPLLSITKSKVKVTGVGTLKGRPNQFLIQALRDRGVNIRGTGEGESIPVLIKGGTFQPGNITIDGSLSSQFISALLIACPQLEGDSRIFITGKETVSSDYITMTLQMLEKAGIKIVRKGNRQYLIKGNQKFKGLKNFYVPADYGLAAFLLACAALVESNVILRGNLKDDLIQADGRILSLLEKMGVYFTKTSRAIKIQGPFKLKGKAFSLKDCPDLVPIMAVLALFAEGTTRLYDIEHVRAKESDRISDLRKELLKIGAAVSEKRNELAIEPQKHYKENCLLDPHNDHRLAMAFAVLGLKTAVRVKNIGCTAKSYPGFVADLKALGAKVSVG